MSKPTQTLEELQLTYESWWNTSDGLESEFPGIQETRGWTIFKGEYDKPLNQQTRLENYARASQFRISPELIRLKDLAQIAAENQIGSLLQDHRNLDAAQAGALLGKRVLHLLSPDGWESFQECAEVLKDEDKARNENFRGDRSIIAEMISAFLSFLERERRLPAKKELRIEANRMLENLSASDARRNDPRWDERGATDYLKKAGFSCLPKSHSAK